MTNKSDRDPPRYRALLELLRTADTIWGASRLFFARWDLSPSQFNILNLLRLNPEGLSQTDLGRELIMHRSNVTGLVDRLEKRGLVRRAELEADRRAWRVLLTPAGDRLVSKILPSYHAGAVGLWDGVSEARVRAVVADLERVKANAERRAAGQTSYEKQPGNTQNTRKGACQQEKGPRA
jgi:MarR family 2-MHQ and catechol resistance regulon transcriptional repressor